MLVYYYILQKKIGFKVPFGPNPDPLSVFVCAGDLYML